MEQFWRRRQITGRYNKLRISGPPLWGHRRGRQMGRVLFFPRQKPASLRCGKYQQGAAKRRKSEERERRRGIRPWREKTASWWCSCRIVQEVWRFGKAIKMGRPPCN